MDLDKALKKFYEKHDAAQSVFKERTDGGKIHDYKAWLTLFETKEQAKEKLADRIPGLHFVRDFYHHARNHTLKQAIEQAKKLQEQKEENESTEVICKDRKKSASK